MKKFICILSLLGIISCSFAQRIVLDSLTLSAGNSKCYFYADLDVNSGGSVFYSMGPGVIVGVGSLGTSLSTSMNKFINYLDKSYNKFQEWSVVAKKNGMNTFVKEIPIGCPGQTVFSYNEGVWFKCNVNLNSFLYVDESGKCYLVIETGDLNLKEHVKTNTSNISFVLGVGWMFGNGSNVVSYERRNKGGFLVFSSKEEIDMFIDKLQKVVSWKNNNIEKGKLLK